MVHAYGAKEMKAFCCECKEVTVHRYESFSKAQPDSEVKGFFSGLLAAVASSLMEDEATGDYKCKVCSTHLYTPDYLD